MPALPGLLALLFAEVLGSASSGMQSAAAGCTSATRLMLFDAHKQAQVADFRRSIRKTLGQTESVSDQDNAARTAHFVTNWLPADRLNSEAADAPVPISIG